MTDRELNQNLSGSASAAPEGHEQRPSMATPTLEPHPEGCRGGDGRHHTQLQPLRLQERPLLDVQLQEGIDLALGHERLVQDVLQKQQFLLTSHRHEEKHKPVYLWTTPNSVRTSRCPLNLLLGSSIYSKRAASYQEG